MLLEVQNCTKTGQTLHFSLGDQSLEIEFPVGLKRIGILKGQKTDTLLLTLSSQDYRDIDILRKTEFPLKRDIIEIRDRKDLPSYFLDQPNFNDKPFELSLELIEAVDFVRSDADLVWEI